MKSKEKISKSEKNIRNEKGITLIALVVTIIVLLLLALITLATLTGKNGITDKVIQAREENNKGSVKEKVKIEILGSINNQGELDWDLLEKELEKNLGAKNISAKDEENKQNRITFEVDENGTTYTVTVDANKNVLIDGETISEGTQKKPKLNTLITSTNYGQNVIYNVDLDENKNNYDWKIFYTNSTNVYLISAEYLRINQLPTGSDMTSNSTYNVYWSRFNKTGMSDISNDVANMFLLNRFKNTYSTSGNSNCKAVATILDTNLWSKFAAGIKGAVAVGAPPIELWTASWNAHSNYTKVYADRVGTIGYYVGTITNPSTTNTNVASNTGYNDTLYFPHKDLYSGCDGYWLASPSQVGTEQLNHISSGGNISQNAYNITDNAMRPIVCLPANVRGEYNGTAWELSL